MEAGGGGTVENEVGENAGCCPEAGAFAASLDAGAFDGTSDQLWLGEEALAAGAADTSTGANGEEGGGETSDATGTPTAAQLSETEEAADGADGLTGLDGAAAITGVNCAVCCVAGEDAG